MRAWFSRLRLRFETTVWVVPAACLLVAVALSFGAELVDGRLSDTGEAWYLFKGGPVGARAVLSTLASSLMTVTGVVFSLTVLVLQLASNQFSSRALRSFLGDRIPQVVLGTFVGSFVYTLLALRTVRDETQLLERHVPALTVTIALVLGVACMVALVYFVHHIAQSIRAVNVLARIGDDGREQLGRLYPDAAGDDPGDAEPWRPDGPPAAVIPLPGKSGVVVTVDEAVLWRSTRPDVVLSLTAAVGDFVGRGAPLFEVWGDASAIDAAAVIDAVAIDVERSERQDLLFVFRELVDIAERALSPGLHDPTTAVQAMDQLHDLLRALVRRRFPTPCRLADDGAVRLVLPRPAWDAYVRLAVDEIRRAGEGEIQVVRRLRHMLLDLLSVAPPSRQGVLHRELELLDAAVRRSFTDEGDLRLALRPSAQGHGAP